MNPYLTEEEKAKLMNRSASKSKGLPSSSASSSSASSNERIGMEVDGADGGGGAGAGALADKDDTDGDHGDGDGKCDAENELFAEALNGAPTGKISNLYDDARITHYQWEEVVGSAGVKQGGETVTKNSYRVEIQANPSKRTK